MLLEYALQTILILPSAAALLLATCLLSIQLFVVPLHFLPDAVVTRLRKRSSSHYINDSLSVKTYDFVIVGGTLSSHVWFIHLQKQYPKASILLLEPPLLDYRSLIFTFFAGLDIGVTHNVPYFRSYPFYRASSTIELTQQENPKLLYVRHVINTFEILINELAKDLTAAATQQQNDNDQPTAGIKLPCYRIVQRVDPSTIHTGALGCRHVFPIQYSDLRNSQNLKVLLGVESITWLGYTKNRQRLAVQVNIQNQEQPFLFHVNRDLHLFDTMNATGSTEPIIQEYHFDQFTEEEQDDDDNDDDDGVEKVSNSLSQRFYAFRRISVDEDSCALWTFDLAEEFDGDPSSDSKNVIEILIGFSHASSTTMQEKDNEIGKQQEEEQFFETATSFKVLPLTQVSEGWAGLEIQQTVYNDSKHHLMHWGYEMIQRVFDSLNSEGIMDIHSDTASVNTIPPESPRLSSSTNEEEQQQQEMTPNHLQSSPNSKIKGYHSNKTTHARVVHRPQVDYLVVKDNHGFFDKNGEYYYNNNSEQKEQQHQGLPSYLSRIWNLVFVDDQATATNNKVSELLSDPSSAQKHHPFSTTFVQLLQSRASYFHKKDPAILRSTIEESSHELNQPSSSTTKQSMVQSQNNIILNNNNDDDDDDEEEEFEESHQSFYASLNDTYYHQEEEEEEFNPSPLDLYTIAQGYGNDEEDSSNNENDDEDEEDDDDDNDTATVTTSEDYEEDINHSQSSSSSSSSSSSENSDDEAPYDNSEDEDIISNEHSENEQEQDNKLVQLEYQSSEKEIQQGEFDEDQSVNMFTDDELNIYQQLQQQQQQEFEDFSIQQHSQYNKQIQEKERGEEIKQDYEFENKREQQQEEETKQLNETVTTTDNIKVEDKNCGEDEEQVSKETMTQDNDNDTQFVEPEQDTFVPPINEAQPVNDLSKSGNHDNDEKENDETFENELHNSNEDLSSSQEIDTKDQEKETEALLLRIEPENPLPESITEESSVEEEEDNWLPATEDNIIESSSVTTQDEEVIIEDSISKSKKKRKAKKTKKKT